MKILLLGHNGYLGSYLRSELTKRYADTQIDIYPNSIYYDFFINCAGKTRIEYCENNPTESKNSNVDLISNICDQVKINKIIHFSTYYVYDQEGLCKEDAQLTNSSMYAKHKIESETIALKYDAVVFRLGKIYGNIHGKQEKITESAMYKNILYADAARFNPVSVETILDAIEHQIEEEDLEGIYNLSDLGETTHYEYTNFIKEKCNPKLEVVFKEGLNHPILSSYGRFCMDTKKIQKHIKIKPWQNLLTQYLLEKKNYDKDKR